MLDSIMFYVYRARKVTRLDLLFGGSLLAISLILALNLLIQSILLIYVAIFLVLGILFYGTERHGGERDSLRAVWISGALSLVLYPLIDYVFESKLGLVAYLTDDLKLLATPLYVPLYWLLGIQLFGYFYHRILGLTNKIWVGALATGLFSAVSATLVENLFNAMGFYRNTPGHYMIGRIPLYVPLGYIVAFSLMPFYLRCKYICGFLLYGFVGIGWYLFALIVP
jgi:hypothetical protein